MSAAKKRRSRKETLRPNLKLKLHKSLTYAKPQKDIVEKVVRVNRGQFKRKIWIGREDVVITSRFSSTHNNNTPYEENERALIVYALRKLLVKMCGKDTPPPLLTFERWILDSVSKSTRKENEDALLGALIREKINSRTTIVRDLVRASIDLKRALNISRAVQSKARELLGKRNNKNSSSSNDTVLIKKHRHTSDIKFGKSSKRILKINHEHYNKLSDLWSLYNHDNNTDTKLFHEHLYMMLSRYHTIQGHGFQAACPEMVFDFFRKYLNVNFECFASPCNTYFGRYCSAFSDVDYNFGSSGSFWNWEPSSGGGSYQANPPFVSTVMRKMAQKIERILGERKDKPMSFVVIVPGWEDDEGYQIMSRSVHMRRRVLISKHDHGFVDGAQQQRRDRFRTSPFDTAVFVLQNELGARKWPVTHDHNSNFETQLRVAFASGVPSEAVKKRRMRDGRGFGDEDGGGGVYRGKKKNRTGNGVMKRKKKERKRRRKN
jgi:phosphorylated CTD-interacting factor 1